MKLIKENTNMIVRILVMHIGILFFGLLLATATSSYNNLLLLSGIFSTVFYLCLLYATVWEYGAKDVIRVEAGRAPARPWLGFFTATVASGLEIVVVLLMILGYILGYTAIGSEFGIGLFGICRIILYVWQAPYLGIVNTLLMAPTTANGLSSYMAFGVPTDMATYYLIVTLVYVVLLIPSVAAAGLGYFSGYKNFRIFGKKKQNR